MKIFILWVYLASGWHSISVADTLLDCYQIREYMLDQYPGTVMICGPATAMPIYGRPH